MREYTKSELENLLTAHGVKKCSVCGEYEKPKTGLEGIGGIQCDDLGTNSKGEHVHLKCARR